MLKPGQDPDGYCFYFFISTFNFLITANILKFRHELPESNINSALSSKAAIKGPIVSDFAVFIGATSVAPQILISLALDIAPTSKRASLISIVFSGLLFGILIACFLAGIIAQYVTWSVVYYLAICIQCALVAMLWAAIPDYPAKNRNLTYVEIICTMDRLAITEPRLIQASLICMASTACFSCYWVTLTLLSGGPSYHYSTWVVSLDPLAYFVLLKSHHWPVWLPGHVRCIYNSPRWALQ